MLVTGWEPDVPIGDTLVRRALHAMADRSEATAAAAGKRVVRTDDASIVDLGSPVGFDNAVVLLKPPDALDLDAVVASALDVFPPERWWTLLSAFPLPPPGRYGLDLVGHPPLMVRPPAPLPAPPHGLDVVAVEDEAGLGDVEAVLAGGFGLPPVPGGALQPALVDVVELFVGYAGGEAVACAASWAAHGVAEVTLVATVPAARGRGYGAALTAAAVAAFPSLPAVLISSDDGRSVYRRLGFLDVLRCTMWQRPGPAGGF